MPDGDTLAGQIQVGAVKFGVGQSTLRREDDRFLRGAGRYVDDITQEGQTHAVFLRSPEAHGRLAALELSAARTAPGVLAAYAAADLAAFGLVDQVCRAFSPSPNGAPLADVAQPQLARDIVRFVGEPIAVVVGESAAAARDALDLIELDIEAWPAVTDGRRALAPGAPEIHAAAPGNRAHIWEAGDAEKTAAAFAAADQVVRVDVVNQRVVVNAMEPRAINVAFDADSGRYTVYCATQGVHGMRAQIAAQLGVSPEAVRVITPDVGGGFGMKLMVHREYAVVAAAARQLGRPVKWTADRSESFVSDAQGRDLATEVEGAFAADGTLLGIRARSVSNVGAYFSQAGPAVHAAFSAPLLGGMYRNPTVHLRVEGAITNTTPTDAYRGAGRPEIIYVTERLMEAAALQLGIDRAAIRLKNLLTAAEMPFETPGGGATYDSGDCKATLETALAAADYAGAAARKAAARARGRALGVGVAYYMERTGGGPVENARIDVHGDGRVVARVGTQNTGQGHETAWGQLIASALGVPAETIVFPDGDSDALPAGGGTGGSRSLIMAHRVFAIAAEEAIEKGKSAAAQALEVAARDVEFSPEQGGRFRVAGTDRAVDWFAAAAAAEGGVIEALGGVGDRMATFPNGAHVAEVEIDPLTGQAELARYTVVDDFGTVLNPLLVAGQAHGGIAQGVGQALFEAAVFDPETGQPLAGSFMDYQMPRAADFPNFQMQLVATAPTPTNPLGAKGCGEAGSVAGIPAASLAVHDALRDLGAGPIETPLTPARIWTALQLAGRRAG